MNLTHDQACLLRNCTATLTNNSDLTELEQEILFYLATSADDDGLCKHSLKPLTQRFDLDEDVIKSIIDSLNQKGRLFSSLAQRSYYAHRILSLAWPIIPPWLEQIANHKIRRYVQEGLGGHWGMLPGSDLSSPERLLCFDIRRRVIALTNQDISHPNFGINWISHPVLRGETRRDIAGLVKPNMYPRISNIKKYASLSYKEEMAWKDLWD